LKECIMGKVYNDSKGFLPVRESSADICCFSIIVPVYQVEDCLERCVDSLLGQTTPEYEVLLVDDGSRDRSGDICEEYARKDFRVRVFHKKNGGLSSARNYGIDHAKGKYVLFVDSDDYVDLTLCRELKAAAARHPRADVFVYGGLEEKDGSAACRIRREEPERRKTWTAHDYMLYAYQSRSLNVQAWLYAYRREFLDRNGLRFKEGILHEDVEFTPRALLKARQIVEVPGNFYHYVIRENSISTSRNMEKNIRDLFRTLQEQCRLAEQQERELRKWMKNGILDSYLNMLQEAEMYRPEYRNMIRKSFLWGKAATLWNHGRVLLCTVSVRGYCFVNSCYKALRQRRKR